MPDVWGAVTDEKVSKLMAELSEMQGSLIAASVAQLAAPLVQRMEAMAAALGGLKTAFQMRNSDYVALEAMKVILANVDPNEPYEPCRIAAMAYHLADDMMEQSQKRHQQHQLAELEALKEQISKTVGKRVESARAEQKSKTGSSSNGLRAED
jgi:hypothetical protein